MVTRSGCASAARLKGRCPLISAKVGIGHTNSSHFGGGVNYLQPWGPIRTLGGGGNRHPLYDSTPAGATDARVGAPFESGPSENHSRNFAGTGALPAPLRSDHRRGRRMRCRRDVPNLVSQPRPSGSATKRVLSPFFTRTRTVRLPCVRAVVMTSRTSVGVETDLPATSRMTSPVEKP